MPIRSARRRRRWAAALVVALTAAACGHGAAITKRKAEPPYAGPLDAGVVKTSMGSLRGMAAADYRVFQGIPYAAAPVGPLRWQLPRPAPKWPGILDATKPGPQCMQDTGPDPRVGKPTSENCLTLNVWTPPRGQHGEKRPVMVWIHGGGFVNGSGDIYHSRSLVVKGHIVVVTINYRLGALGFLAHPSLGPPGDVGNYGLADQQAALRWVRDNISAFGGDPFKVTIAGESAGGMSVCDHLVAPGSVGLFRAAIIQSAPCQAQADLATGQRRSVDYAAQAGCRNPAITAVCLRALPAARLDRPPWYYLIGDSDGLSGPVTGATVLPDGPFPAIATGRAARVPVLVGVNHDEFTMFAAFRHRKLGRGVGLAEYSHVLDEIFGGDGAPIMAHYPPDHFGGDVSLAYSAAITDGVFACTTDRLADSLSRNAPVYAYEFDDPHAPAPEPLRDAPFPVGASHSLELAYLFNVGGLAPFDAAQQVLSDQMISYWTRFVSTGTPKAPGLPDWPAQDGSPDHKSWMSLRPSESQLIADFDEEHQCPFWASLKGRS
ncbi:carboxylesterase/lipase family protein [Mycobacterium cookii]|uniref:carboxylesterase/lipase family protein n=1 Tax=Mycobacterium cookii TaxID=1775 RepID=UPI001E5D6908|nr:carboxylesterase family protein [Mycobacterium cookii]